MCHERCADFGPERLDSGAECHEKERDETMCIDVAVA
jgi:hypothetical protein